MPFHPSDRPRRPAPPKNQRLRTTGGRQRQRAAPCEFGLVHTRLYSRPPHDRSPIATLSSFGIEYQRHILRNVVFFPAARSLHLDISVPVLFRIRAGNRASEPNAGEDFEGMVVFDGTAARGFKVSAALSHRVAHLPTCVAPRIENSLAYVDSRQRFRLVVFEYRLSKHQ